MSVNVNDLHEGLALIDEWDAGHEDIPESMRLTVAVGLAKKMASFARALLGELRDAKTACEHNRSEAESLREQRREDTATRKRLMTEVMDARAFAKTSVTAMQVQLDRAVGLAENATAETSRARDIAEQWAFKAERLNDAIGAAILASDNDGGSAGDAIQDMLLILREASS